MDQILIELKALLVVGFLFSPILAIFITKDIEKVLINFVIWLIVILMIFQNVA